MTQHRYLTAQEAATALGISLATLYTYVSRGYLRSEPDNSTSRTRRYRFEDVRRLVEHKEGRRDPAKVAERVLYLGEPVLESAMTLIADGRYYYRGYDALQLSTSHTVEQVATLMWMGHLTEEAALFGAARAEVAERYQRIRPFHGRLLDLPLLEQFQVLLPLVAHEDMAAYDLRPEAVARTGARILHWLTAFTASATPGEGSIAQMLQQTWAPHDSQAIPLLTAALIICADHELNPTTFTARCVASAGAPPYAVVQAGLAAWQGVRYGAGYLERVETLLREIGSPSNVRPTLAQYLKREQCIPGFGHDLYPDGDPRGSLLLQLLATAYPASPFVAVVASLVEVTRDLLGEAPALELGIVALAQELHLPKGGASTLFAFGRTIGWIGHAIEEYQAHRLIRPRARYVGPYPPLPAEEGAMETESTTPGLQS
jgi:citrate synthase